MSTEPQEDGVAYGYGRVSTEKQKKLGLSRQDQDERLTAYYRGLLAARGLAWGGVYMDVASAYKLPLSHRKAGRALLGRMRRGDHIILTRLDRAFRRFGDAVKQIEDWIVKGITVHILAFSCDTSTATGRMILHILAAVAEHEREMISERTREACRIRKRRTGLSNQYAGYGFRLVGPAGKKRAVPDPHERAVMARIVQLRDDCGWRFEAIEQCFFRENLRTRGKRLWSLDRIKRAYRQEHKLRQEAMPTSSCPAPSTSPVVAKDSVTPSPATSAPTTTTPS